MFGAFVIMCAEIKSQGQMKDSLLACLWCPRMDVWDDA